MAKEKKKPATGEKKAWDEYVDTTLAHERGSKDGKPPMAVQQMRALGVEIPEGVAPRMGAAAAAEPDEGAEVETAQAPPAAEKATGTAAKKKAKKKKS